MNDIAYEVDLWAQDVACAQQEEIQLERDRVEAIQSTLDNLALAHSYCAWLDVIVDSEFDGDYKEYAAMSYIALMNALAECGVELDVPEATRARIVADMAESLMRGV